MSISPMTEVPIQISRLVVHPTSSASSSLTLVQPTAAATGSAGFKLSLLTSRKPPLHCGLVFCNFYVGYLRIVQVNVDGSSTELVTAYPLMQHLHYEDDAQNWQLVKLDQLPVSWNPHVFDSLCVYLSQPSPLWTTWELRDVNLRELAEDVEDTRSEATITSQLESESPPRANKRLSLSRDGRTVETRLSNIFERRASRMAVAQGVDSAANPVEEQAKRCLDLVLRLRELVQQ